MCVCVWCVRATPRALAHVCMHAGVRTCAASSKTHCVEMEHHNHGAPQGGTPWKTFVLRAHTLDKSNSPDSAGPVSRELRTAWLPKKAKMTLTNCDRNSTGIKAKFTAKIGTGPGTKTGYGKTAGKKKVQISFFS